MKIVKWILGIIVFLLMAAVVSTFFMGKDYTITHTQVVKALPEAVFNQINVTKNWKNWSYWDGLDEKMVTTYNDIPSGVGASYAWKSEKKDLGSGSLTITGSYPNDSIICKLVFDGHGDASSAYYLKPVDGGTELTSVMYNKTPGILDKLMSRAFKGMMIKAFKASADNMETYLQAHPEANQASKPTDSLTVKAAGGGTDSTKISIK